MNRSKSTAPEPIGRANPDWTRVFFAPLALKRNLTQEEFEEFNVFQLADYLFCYDDNAPFAQLDEFEYDTIDISNSALTVKFARPDHKGERRLEEASAHPLRFKTQFSFDQLNPIPASIREQFFSAVDGIWNYLVDDFRWLTREGDLEIFARVNSPTAPFKEITPDAFEHFEIVEWERGVAEARSGERHFSIHAHRPVKAPPVPMAPERERYRPAVDRAADLIAPLWPEVPDRITVSDKELVAKVQKAAEDRRLPVPKRDSILRAAGRATDRRQRK